LDFVKVVCVTELGKGEFALDFAKGLVQKVAALAEGLVD
jgi:hypothetical protein